MPKELTKDDVNKEIKNFISTSEFKDKIGKIVAARLKDKDFEADVIAITKSVIAQLYKTLWTKKSFWSNNIKNAQP